MALLWGCLRGKAIHAPEDLSSTPLLLPPLDFVLGMIEWIHLPPPTATAVASVSLLSSQVHFFRRYLPLLGLQPSSLADRGHPALQLVQAGDRHNIRGGCDNQLIAFLAFMGVRGGGGGFHSTIRHHTVSRALVVLSCGGH